MPMLVIHGEINDLNDNLLTAKKSVQIRKSVADGNDEDDKDQLSVGNILSLNDLIKLQREKCYPEVLSKIIFKIVEISDIQTKKQKDKMKKVKDLKLNSVELDQHGKFKNEEFSLSYQYLKIQIKNYMKDGQEQFMIQIQDISQDLLVKKIENERDFQQLINATVSHEMRNPLNSIINLTKDLQAKIEEINSIIKLGEEEEDGQETSVLTHYFKEFMEEAELNCKRQNSSS